MERCWAVVGVTLRLEPEGGCKQSHLKVVLYMRCTSTSMSMSTLRSSQLGAQFDMLVQRPMGTGLCVQVQVQRRSLKEMLRDEAQGI